MVIYDAPGAHRAASRGRPGHHGAPCARWGQHRRCASEQESPDTATVRTAGFSTRITIDVNPERNLIKQGPRAA